MSIIEKTFLLKLGKIIFLQLVPLNSGGIPFSSVEWFFVLYF